MAASSFCPSGANRFLFTTGDHRTVTTSNKQTYPSKKANHSYHVDQSHFFVVVLRQKKGITNHLIFVFLILTSLFTHCNSLRSCKKEVKGVRPNATILLNCCSSSVLYQKDFQNLSIKWTVDAYPTEKASYKCISAPKSSATAPTLLTLRKREATVTNTSEAGVIDDENATNSTTPAFPSAKLTLTDASTLIFSTAPLAIKAVAEEPEPACEFVVPTFQNWDMSVNRTDSSLSSVLKSRAPLQFRDSGLYECLTSRDGVRYASVVDLLVRDKLPKDSLEKPVIPHIGLVDGNITVKICWNGSQWPPERYDTVSHYEVRILRQSDKAQASFSKRIPAKSPFLYKEAHGTLNDPQWPLKSSCCCWQVPLGDLRPFSSYVASYRAIADGNLPLKSATDFSKEEAFQTRGPSAKITEARVVQLNEYGTGAVVAFTVEPVKAEVAVTHELNITVSTPSSKSAVLSYKYPVQDTPKVNKTIDGLKQFTLYEVSAFVENPNGESRLRNFSFITLPGELNYVGGLRAYTIGERKIGINFTKPTFKRPSENFQALDYSYSIVHQILEADYSSTICPSAEELCAGPLLAYKYSDCKCHVSSKTTSYLQEALSIDGLHPNRPYRISVRYFFNSDQLAPYNELWPKTLYSPWASLSGKGYVFTESIPIATPPYIQNINLTVLVDNSTDYKIKLKALIDVTVNLQDFEEVWAVEFRCLSGSRTADGISDDKNGGSWSEVIPISGRKSNGFIRNRKVSSVSQPSLSSSPWTVEVVTTTYLIDQFEDRFPDICQMVACPFTPSRKNRTCCGTRGPCSASYTVKLPSRSSDKRMLSAYNSAVSTAVAIVIATVIIILALVLGVLFYFRKQRHFFCCLNRKLLPRRSRGDASRGTNADSGAASPTGMQLLPQTLSSSQAQPLLQNHIESVTSNSKTTAGNKRVSTISSSDGPLTGSIFCYKVASASFSDFAQEFACICSLAAAEAKQNRYSTSVAEQAENTNKNRYSNVLPFDHSRVTLLNADYSDYVNANFVTGDEMSSIRFIAAQGPLPSTVADFWQVVWERNVSKIVMLTDLVETAIESVRKCAPYWPKNVAQSTVYKNFRVTVVRKRQRSFWVERVFELVHTQESNADRRLVMHFQFTDWPDHGVPAAALPLLRFTQRVMMTTDDGDLDEPPPIVVHCSAGIGRSGVFMVLANELQRLATKCQLNPAGCLLTMRSCRPGLVQTPEQFRFIYLALYEAVRALEVGDHCGFGVPTEPNRLQAWLKFDADHNSKICDWATSRIPCQVSSSENNYYDSGELDNELAFSTTTSTPNSNNNKTATTECNWGTPVTSNSYQLPGPLHSKQIAILTSTDLNFILQRLRIWALMLANVSASAEPAFSMSALVKYGHTIHVVIIDGHPDVENHLKTNYPNMSCTSLSTQNWPLANPAAVLSKIMSFLLPSAPISNNSSNLDNDLVPSIDSVSGGSSSASSDSRYPVVAIICGGKNSQSQLSSLNLAAELVLAVQCLSETRLAFSLDADPDPDGHIDLLLLARTITLALPQGALTCAGLRRSLGVVSTANINNNINGSINSNSGTFSI